MKPKALFIPHFTLPASHLLHWRSIACHVLNGWLLLPDYSSQNRESYTEESKRLSCNQAYDGAHGLEHAIYYGEDTAYCANRLLFNIFTFALRSSQCLLTESAAGIRRALQVDIF